jgi:DNA-binding transcriptional ArsR family regulator
MNAEDGMTLADVFAALGDSNRQHIVELLAAQGAATSTTLARQLPISRQGTEKHLAILARAGLVHSERRGREVLYALRVEKFSGSSAWLNRVADNWERRLDAIKRLAEE